MAKFKIDFLESYEDESILTELRRIAKKVKKDTVTKADIEGYGRISYPLVYSRFGSLRHALETAGLRTNRFMKATNSELLKILIELWELVLEKEGRTPERKDLKKYNFPVSGDTYFRRFGTWKKALMKAYESVEADSLDDTDTSSALKEIKNNKSQKKRKHISLRKRFFVMKRDSFACVKCGTSGHGVRLEVDHKVSVAQRGTDALDNLQTLCFDCNRGKRDSLE